MWVSWRWKERKRVGFLWGEMSWEEKEKKRWGFLWDWGEIRGEERKEEDLEDVTLQDPRFGTFLLDSGFRLSEN